MEREKARKATAREGSWGGTGQGAGWLSWALSFGWTINLCVCTRVCLSIYVHVHTARVQGFVVGIGMIPTIFSFPNFFQGPPSSRHPTPTPHFPVFLVLQGPFQRYFHISGILAFSLGMQTSWNVQPESVESRGPSPHCPPPHACSPAAPVHLLLPLLYLSLLLNDPSPSLLPLAGWGPGWRGDKDRIYHQDGEAARDQGKGNG